MNHSNLATYYLSKGDYQNHYNHTKKYHDLIHTPESSSKLNRAISMLSTFKDLQSFLQISKDDYYSILNISRDSDSKTIETSYKKLILKFHPNRNFVPECNEAVKRIQTAYNTLNDPVKKEEYDRKLMNRYGGDVYDDFYEILRRRVERERNVYFGDFTDEFLFRQRYQPRVVRREMGMGSVVSFIVFVMIVLWLI